MHRLLTIPGGWTPGTEGVVFVDQTPGDLIFLTAADTEIQTLSVALKHWIHPTDLRAANLLNLQQQLSIDTYAESVLEQAKAIMIRLLGGREYWPYGLEVVADLAQSRQIHLYLLPGDGAMDLELMEQSTVPFERVHRLWRYLQEGGVNNFFHGFEYVYSFLSPDPISIKPVQSIENWGCYRPLSRSADLLGNSEAKQDPPKCGILFYRAHYLSGNLEPIDALVAALAERGIAGIPFFVQSLKEPEILLELQEALKGIDLLLNTTGFALNSATGQSFYKSLNVPVLQAILAGTTQEIWEETTQGLTPRDLAMNVVLPEMDGRIISRAISFKSEAVLDPNLDAPIIRYQSEPSRIAFVADLVTSWITLRRKSISERRIALILANYPNKDGRLANGVGLDTPNSCVEILKKLAAAGYEISHIPKDGDELIQWLTNAVTNDPESFGGRTICAYVSVKEYQQFFQQLPRGVQAAVIEQWGEAPGTHRLRQLDGKTVLPIPGLLLGQVFIGIQPSRGYDADPKASYHSPDLVPPHPYFAFYNWIRSHFQADGIVHVGKHGNLEWLPGKGIALSENCFPEAVLSAIPNFYPFIVNDPGEGAQAKRRTQAVILDHMIPPMTRAETYGPLQELEHLADEYYTAMGLDPTRLQLIEQQIRDLLTQHELHRDLGVDPTDPLSEWLTQLDGYLCELKEAQIRDGLHILGQIPQGSILVELLVALTRLPNPPSFNLGLTQQLAQDLGLDLDPLTVDFAEPWQQELSDPVKQQLGLAETPRIAGDVVTALENLANRAIAKDLEHSLQPPPTCDSFSPPLAVDLRQWIQSQLLPRLQSTHQELDHLLLGLAGGYIPPGPSGSPTRGRLDVLPTGRNFYSLDSRGIPTRTAWDLGYRAAERLIERHVQEQGEYPRRLGLSVWGTSTMRTGGDDIAQALALLGVQPIWEPASGRVVDFEVLPVSALSRPRIDVMLRVSGFFRDAFSHLMDLFQKAVEVVGSLDESTEDNPIRAQIEEDRKDWQQQGLSGEQAQEQALYRVFGSKPGAYGAGLQGLIDGQNWMTDEDLARAYVNWGGYAYYKNNSKPAHTAFSRRLAKLELVLHNQDNREHDLLDSDDYYQFQGGMIAAVRALSGSDPQSYFGDNSRPLNPKVKTLAEEIAKVYRSRVINPKWIRGVMRHGYKGAFEMAATVDYLFAYDATTHVVTDYMYHGIAEAYLLDPAVRSFLATKNPWAMRDMGERLLEAHQRGLWQADPVLVDRLQTLVLEAEAEVEGKIGPTTSEDGESYSYSAPPAVEREVRS